MSEPNPKRVASGKRLVAHVWPRTCPYCKDDFMGTAKQKYCCRAHKEAAKGADRSPRKCLRCGDEIVPKQLGQRPKYCSTKCRGKSRGKQNAP